MKQNIKVAKELVRIAKKLFNEEDLEFSNSNFPQYYLHADEPCGRGLAEDKIEQVIVYAIKHKLISSAPEIINTSSNDAYDLYECRFELDETTNWKEIENFEKYMMKNGFNENPYL